VLHQVGDLFELNVKLWCQKVKLVATVKTKLIVAVIVVIYEGKGCPVTCQAGTERRDMYSSMNISLWP
jgi:hypothetical protein